ncbi:MAG: hypothetical protein KIT46_07185 [Anaerolineales bacterium]|nr:hypothetical protein [Anaerolineales bacterium]MCW5855811.1 hypothetical protein [Anaerolineales bacterium]
MEKEQLEKKVEWLDAERRKALDTIAALEARLAKLESQPKQENQSKTLTSHKTRLDTYGKQLAELDKLLKSQQSAEKKDLQDVKKKTSQLEKSFAQENKSVNKLLQDFRQEILEIQSMQKSIHGHREQLAQLEGRIETVYESIQDVITGEQKRSQLAKSLEDASREDAERLTQMHAEVAALLTRLESTAKQNENLYNSHRKVEKRMDELYNAETTRRQEHEDAQQKLSLMQVENERSWKQWAQRLEAFEKQSAQIPQQLSSLESTEMAVKRAQRSFEDLIDKINRRINELNEIQRLGDQRFRQEWSTFQTDAQKRWSNFTLTQEEQQRERGRQYEKMSEQVQRMEDTLRELQDGLQHLNDQSERNLQALLELARDSLAENERFLSNSR